MSVFGPNQVEEVIFADADASETTIATFIATASDKEIKILSADGTAPAAGEDFKVYQKTAGSAAKGLDYEFSDTIKADKVDSTTVHTYLAESLKEVTVSGFTGNIVANTTYAVEVRIVEDGSFSTENFSTVTGYYVTGASIAGITDQIIQDAIIDSLNANFTRRGGGEIVAATVDADSFTVTGIAQEVVLGKIIGRQIDFDVNAKQFDDTAVNHENLGLLAVVVDTANNPGAGTGKYALNLEWFTKGYKYEAYRQTGFPADFTERTPFYAKSAGVYNVIHIKYKDSRISPTVEEQPRVLTIFVDKVTDTLANNANTNLVLDDLQLILGAANVPADLPVV